MKKKIWIIIAIAAILAILFVPIPTGQYKDGGTREYTALTYKIVNWNRLTEDGTYDETRVYFFPNNFKSIDSLWQMEEGKEEGKAEKSFTATVIQINGSYVLVEPIEGEDELRSSDRITFNIDDLGDIGAELGSVVEISYTGVIMESYPAQINATGWKLLTNLRDLEFTDDWLDKNTAEKCDSDIFSDIVITGIYSDCFLAVTVIPMPYQIKLNGSISDEWCVGDQVICTYENTYYDAESNRVEADLLTIEASTFDINNNVYYKPVIYLYPEEETEVSVSLKPDGKLTCTYPAYNGGWTVTASPDGTLTDGSGQTYNYLYWEGETHAQWDMSEGFCIKGEDTAEFLEAALAELGLNRREANEFIVFWLPLMEHNPYNIISFQTDLYTEAAQLEVEPAPDTLIRVFMAWKGVDEHVDIPMQKLTAPERTGFTVVEWGGTEIK